MRKIYHQKIVLIYKGFDRRIYKLPYKVDFPTKDFDETFYKMLKLANEHY